MDNVLRIINVNELSNYSFFVPAYQRGYRWTNLEVKDLLNDICDFKPKEIDNSDEKTWYCLQPLVVKKRINDEKYELIDGQQRLTTIYLILHYLNQDYVENRRDKLFDLDYETRKESKSFLLNPEKESNENIDYYYISQAYKTITDWFEKKPNHTNFDKNDFRSKIKFNTKFIWYEIIEDSTIPVFSRLNIGKISLTNAELIKALFLNSSLYSKDLSIKQRQFEIAAEWDNIETELQNNRFWYFISNEKRQTNRIELIFNLIANKDDNDVYSTFRFFYNAMNSKNIDTINEYWKKVKDRFQRFSEWFKKRDWYHKIGFILYQQIDSINNLYKVSCEKTKSEFSLYLDELISKYYQNSHLLDLQYGDSKTRSVLLLYNIATMLNNDQEDSYFPFDTFKIEKWDIEHIASLKDNDSIPKKEDRKQWLDDSMSYIEKKDGKKLLKQIEETDINNDNQFEDLIKNIIDYFNKNITNETTGQIDEPNGISNLTLLDSYTNRSYKNSVFPLKRKRIIERDKSGKFVPLCTKNTFLKYFSDYPPKISFWTKDDRIKYEEDLVSVLKKYMEVE